MRCEQKRKNIFIRCIPLSREDHCQVTPPSRSHIVVIYDNSLDCVSEYLASWSTVSPSFAPSPVDKSSLFSPEPIFLENFLSVFQLPHCINQKCSPLYRHYHRVLIDNEAEKCSGVWSAGGCVAALTPSLHKRRHEPMNVCKNRRTDSDCGWHFSSCIHDLPTFQKSHQLNI